MPFALSIDSNHQTTYSNTGPATAKVRRELEARDRVRALASAGNSAFYLHSWILKAYVFLLPHFGH
jgi:hypothetical protein